MSWEGFDYPKEVQQGKNTEDAVSTELLEGIVSGPDHEVIKNLAHKLLKLFWEQMSKRTIVEVSRKLFKFVSSNVFHILYIRNLRIELGPKKKKKTATQPVNNKTAVIS